MSIRTNYGHDPRQRKIDQYYELAGLARMDGDYKDEARWLQRIKDIDKEGSDNK